MRLLTRRERVHTKKNAKVDLAFEACEDGFLWLGAIQVVDQDEILLAYLAVSKYMIVV
jgi:hypothetical protein